MGLRINTNTSAVTALRNLRLNDKALGSSLERLSTGLRINRAADDPSGMVISEQLRQQIAALNQAAENTENASNLLSVADSALQEVADLLVRIQESTVFAQNTGGASPAQIAAEQDSVDNAIAAIDRIATTTRYGDRSLLNGNSGYMTQTGALPDLLNDVRLRSVTFAPGASSTSLTFVVNTNPQQARIRVSGVTAVSNSSILRITGPRGTQDVGLASGPSVAAIVSGFAAAVNSVAGYTGVWASSTGAGGDVDLFSEEYGVGQLVRMEMVTGTITTTDGFGFLSNSGSVGDSGLGLALTSGEVVLDRGLDGIVQYDGQLFEGIGRNFSIVHPAIQIQFSLDPELLPVPPAAASGTLIVANTGLLFQVNEFNQPSDRIQFGIDPMTANQLGFEAIRDRIEEAQAGVSSYAVNGQILTGGNLKSMMTGGDNDLFENAGNANSIVKASLEDVTAMRGFLGAVQAFNVDPAGRQLAVAVENLGASLSAIRDLDFAEEISNFVKRQILFQSGIAVLANANAVPQAVLGLITG